MTARLSSGRLLRRLGTVLIVLGIGALAWAVVVWQWQDPITALYTKYEQHELTARYHKLAGRFVERPRPTPASVRHAGGRSRDPALRGSQAAAPAGRTQARGSRQEEPPRLRSRADAATAVAETAAIRAEARRYAASIKRGDPVGRLEVPRLHLSVMIVNGTDSASLTRGPGRYLGSFMPGAGELIYIAGHRTTYMAPFSHIDRLRSGDIATIEVPYGTFEYRVTGHVIVPADDTAVLRSHGDEVLALQACHPRFFASHRYIAYARLERVTPRHGTAYALTGGHVRALGLIQTSGK